MLQSKEKGNLETCNDNLISKKKEGKQGCQGCERIIRKKSTYSHDMNDLKMVPSHFLEERKGKGSLPRFRQPKLSPKCPDASEKCKEDKEEELEGIEVQELQIRYFPLYKFRVQYFYLNSRF